jgi:hypothetical protein
MYQIRIADNWIWALSDYVLYREVSNRTPAPGIDFSYPQTARPYAASTKL